MSDNTSNSASGSEDGEDRILSNYLTDVQLAEELGVSPRTIARWRGLREGPTPTRVGRRVMYHRASVKKWLENCESELVS